MILMECRYITLQNIVAALGRINIPLVGFDGTSLVPFLNYDDIGIYILIPKLVQYFNLSLEQSINIFFYSLLFGAFLLGVVGTVLNFKSLYTTLFSVAGFTLFLRFSMHYVAEVYLAYLIPILAIIPLFLYFYKRNDSLILPFFIFFSGILIGMMHYIRSYSSLAVLGFLLCMIIFNMHQSFSKKIFLSSSLIFGLLSSTSYFLYQLNTYKNYASKHFSHIEDAQMKHVFWHPIYLGFGLLQFSNAEKIVWDDSFALKKAKEVDPTVDIKETKKYENILKNEVIKLFRKHRDFVIWTIFAKIGILLWYLLLFANLGLIVIFFIKHELLLLFSFLIGLLLSSITPVLALPCYGYALNFITFSFLFGLWYLNEFIMQYWVNNRTKIKKIDDQVHMSAIA